MVLRTYSWSTRGCCWPHWASWPNIYGWNCEISVQTTWNFGSAVDASHRALHKSLILRFAGRRLEILVNMLLLIHKRLRCGEFWWRLMGYRRMQAGRFSLNDVHLAPLAVPQHTVAGCGYAESNINNTFRGFRKLQHFFSSTHVPHLHVGLDIWWWHLIFVPTKMSHCIGCASRLGGASHHRSPYHPYAIGLVAPPKNLYI